MLRSGENPPSFLIPGPETYIQPSPASPPSSCPDFPLELAPGSGCCMDGGRSVVISQHLYVRTRARSERASGGAHWEEGDVCRRFPAFPRILGAGATRGGGAARGELHPRSSRSHQQAQEAASPHPPLSRRHRDNGIHIPLRCGRGFTHAHPPPGVGGCWDNTPETRFGVRGGVWGPSPLASGSVGAVAARIRGAWSDPWHSEDAALAPEQVCVGGE